MSDTTPKTISAGQITEALENAAENPVLVDMAQNLANKSSWWKQNRTSVANIAGILLNVMMFIVMVPNDALSTSTAAYIAIGIQGVAATIGIMVPDAISPKQAQALSDYVGRHRKED